MTWLKKRKERLELGPVPPEIVKAHEEAKAVKALAKRTAGAFHRLGVVMVDFHQKNGVADKLNYTYEGKGLL